MLNKFKELFYDEQGQGATEYGLVVALVVAAVLLAVGVFSGALTGLFNKVKTALDGAL
ncbi:MAG: Flp family type IVb pilin [Clostridiaceae bacterium]